MQVPPVERTIQHALERGFLSEAQLEQALRRREQTHEDLLPLLRPFLTPGQLEELRAIYQSTADPDATVNLPARSGPADPLATVALPGGSLPSAPTHATPSTHASGGPRPLRSKWSVGDRVGSYELLGELGRGGMGVVFRARHAELEREVALKLLLAFGDSDRRVLRFVREAEALGRLQHPNIVGVHEAADVDHTPYIVMDLIAGESLEARLRRGDPLEARAAAEITLALAGALQHAHDRGILHRDVKPDNVLLCEDGRALLTDFGLAGELSEDRERLTRTGQIVGTPAYMSPEQAEGAVRQVDERSDVYSLGATLYAALTGQPPFLGNSVSSVLLDVLDTPPQHPTKLRPGLDRDLCRVCLKCLEKEPSERYPRPADLAADLELWLRGERVQARAVGALTRLRRKLRRHPLLAGALALSGAVLVAIGVALLGSGPVLTLTATPTTTHSARLTLEGRIDAFPLRDLRLTRDDQVVQVETGPGGSFQAKLRLTPGANTLRLEGRDWLGRGSQAQIVCVLDQVPPRLTLEAPRLEGGRLVLRGRVSESGCRIQLNQDSVVTAVDRRFRLSHAPKPFEPLVLNVVDPAGNRATLTVPAQVVGPGPKAWKQIEEIPQGGTLLLQAGTYPPLRLTGRAITLVGEGRERTRIASDSEPCLLVENRDARVVLRDLTITLGIDSQKPWAVGVRGGTVRFERCTVVTEVGASLSVEPGRNDEASLLELVDSTIAIDRGALHALRVRGATIRLERCQVIDRRQGGSHGELVALTLRSQARITDTQITMKLGRAVKLTRGSRATLIGCTINSHNQDGVVVTGKGSSATLLRCRVGPCGHVAVLVDNKATARLEDCVLSRKKAGGWPALLVRLSARVQWVRSRTDPPGDIQVQLAGRLVRED